MWSKVKFNKVKNEEFRRKGYIVVRNLLSPMEVETMRHHADNVATNIDAYRTFDKSERNKIIDRNPMTPFLPESTGDPVKHDFLKGMKNSLEEYPEIQITPHHKRRENRVYPSRKYPVDHKQRTKTATEDPFSTFSGQIVGLADDNEYFRSIASHTNMVKILNEILSPDVKLWFDHIFNKAPLNNDPPYGGSNRYHQDGFFHLSKRSVTCWISLDGLTKENGPFHYITTEANYPQYAFDNLGEEAIGETELSQEEIITLNPGDAVFHDRWTLHATGPNESTKRRRGWSIHYADASSKFGEFSGSSKDPQKGFMITPEGYHIRNDIIESGTIHGNRFWHLVSGREHEGCI